MMFKLHYTIFATRCILLIDNLYHDIKRLHHGMLWLQHNLLNRLYDMQNFHHDELLLQRDLNRRITILKTELACHTVRQFNESHV